MFQFPWFASCTYGFSTRYLGYPRWVPPFRDLRIKVCLPTPRSFSQATTSFIASDCQGIHRMRFFTWPYNPKQSGYTVKTTFAENSRLNSQILPWLEWSPVKEIIQSYFYHIPEFLKNSSGAKTRNQCSFTNIHFWAFDDCFRWWSQGGSNSWPPACKAGALPAELWPRIGSRSTPTIGGSGQIRTADLTLIRGAL